jgi:hypothetical protein
MKSLVCIATLVCLSCVVLLARHSDNSTARPEVANDGANQGLRCAAANPASGYASHVNLPDSKREINVYNVDHPESGKHDPICLSKKADDTILWVSGSSKKFKMKISVEKDQDPMCGQQPFVKDPPNDTVDGYFSGSLKTVPDYCLYDVKFQTEDAKISDPHIQTTP